MIIDIEEVILIKNIAIFSTSRWFLFNIVQHVLATIKIADGVEDTIDLIKNKLIYEGSIIFADEIDDQAAYGLLNKAYDKYYNYIKKTFQII
ncbi:hypothetical protein [Enterococcus faecium]|uniref:hypothetical protein n=1 Tax=Enterococcus faecium TaxID=1352 RepID=UPI001376226C|nr:hypothetical protein [Enterococcus faecium]